MDMNYSGGMWEGGGWAGWSGVGGEMGHSIINKYIKKKKRKIASSTIGVGRSGQLHAEKMKLNHQHIPHI